MSDPGALRWKCRRGMKELDDLLLRYLVHRYPAAGTGERHHFESLLDLEDPELAALLLGGDRPDDPELDNVIRAIRGSAPG